LNLIFRGEFAMVRIPTHRAPTHPGEMLFEEFLKPMGLTQRELADAIKVPYQRINEIINGRRGMTPSTALRLSIFFNVSAEFWMNLQLRWDLYFTRQSESNELKSIRPKSSHLVSLNESSVQHGV
jgi:antitoxin HigA-1